MEPEVVIVGAGAAGIGAALELHARGISCVILEAADRVGGRAYTDTKSLPGNWDHGCHFLHCADVNPLEPWAGRLGADYDRRDRIDDVAVWSGGGWLDAQAIARVLAELDEGFGDVYAAAKAGLDVSIAAVVRGRSPILHYVLRLMACADIDLVSTLGYGAYEDTGVNWRVHSGLGTLVARIADGLPVRTGRAVTAIAQEAGGVRLTTAGGTLAGRAAIVTCSTNVLASGAIAFSPGPARDLLDHLEHVPCGDYEKVALALTHLPEQLDDVTGLFIDAGIDEQAPYFQIDTGAHPKMILHMAGNLACDLSAAGEAAMADFATAHLVKAFGSEVRKSILATAVTGWRQNPLVKGAYSYCRAGHAAARELMIAADTGNIAFAGEAFSPNWQATAHGAYQSGRDAAARLASQLKQQGASLPRIG